MEQLSPARASARTTMRTRHVPEHVIPPQNHRYRTVTLLRSALSNDISLVAKQDNSQLGSNQRLAHFEVKRSIRSGYLTCTMPVKASPDTVFP